MKYPEHESRYIQAQKRLQLVKGQVDSRRQELLPPLGSAREG